MHHNFIATLKGEIPSTVNVCIHGAAWPTSLEFFFPVKKGIEEQFKSFIGVKSSATKNVRPVLQHMTPQMINFPPITRS